MRLDCTTEEIQQELLSLLISLDHICRVEHIEYSLHAGTLLGAVREKGFIPWDNDADVFMTREAYERLMNVIGKYTAFDIREYDLLPKFVRSSADEVCPFGWIDIFIFDEISANRFAQCFKIILSLMMRFLYRDLKMIHLLEGNDHSSVTILLSKILSTVGMLVPQDKKREWITNFCKRVLTGNKQFIYRSNDYWRGLRIVEPKSYAQEYYDLMFEGFPLRASRQAHNILQDSYGPDYMIPRREQRAEERHESEKKAMLFNALYGRTNRI